MPQDIHGALWRRVEQQIVLGHVAVTSEIYDEMLYLEVPLGNCVKSNKGALVLEVNDPSWNWTGYAAEFRALQAGHRTFISEYNGGSPKTICLNDLSIVALAKTLQLPLVCMEVSVGRNSQSKRRIPDVCALEKVQPMTFSDFLRAEGIRN
jgi:hypothetical protein